MKKINELKKEYFEDVPIQKYSSEYIGRDEDTILRWRRDDKTFADVVQRAKLKWIRKKMIATKAEFALERLEKGMFSSNIPLSVHQTYNVDIQDEAGKVLSEKFNDFMLSATYAETPQEVTDSARDAKNYMVSVTE